MAQTFKALAAKADWSGEVSADSNGEMPPTAEAGDVTTSRVEPSGSGTFNLHHDIHVHLPATSDVAVYTAIFRALREELRD